MTLKAALVWVRQIGASAVTYFVIDRIPGLKDQVPWVKRIAACAISAAIAIVAYLVQMAMLYEQVPGDVRAWIETLFLVGTSAFGLATLIHTADLVRKARKAKTETTQ